MQWLKRLLKKLKKPKSRVDPDTLAQQAVDSLARTEAQQPEVNRLTQWLNERHNQNGFGEDFEVSLRPREAR